VQAVDPQYEALGEPSVTLDDIKSFRQLGSKCAGHPEYRWTSGVETTTGPLGQGIANSVGMAIASQWMGRYFNRPGFTLFDFNAYAICGDGCLMEGISHEAASLAGHLRLSNLCWIYDNNHITIEGNTALAYSDDVASRFMGYGWSVQRVGDANDVELLGRAFEHFAHTDDRPTLIIVDSHIGWGAPSKQDTSAAHGEPLGEDEIRGAKRRYGWPEDAKFLVPAGVREHFAAASAPAAPNSARLGSSSSPRTGRSFPSSPITSSECSDGSCLRDGTRACHVPRRRQRPRQPRLERQGAERHHKERALVHRRRRRSLSLDEDAAHLGRRRRLRSGQLRRSQLPLRHPRARDVCRPETACH
jgi:transketolase N-terminal domain/subunit